MHFVAVLNRKGGTLRTTDLVAFSKRLRETLESAAHTVDIRIVGGKQIENAIESAASESGVDVILAGGGDGTISAAAAKLAGSRTVLAILPAGTMNLFARSLGIPLTLDGAVAAFADGEVREVDVATANGRPFIHQFSIGLHAKMVHLRSKMEFGSRWGKIRASARAAYDTLMYPPRIDAELMIGDAEVKVRTTGIGITNNLFGEGHLPYADAPDGGVLGIYVTVARERHEVLRYFINVARGKWRDNDQVEIHQAEKVRLKVKPSHRKYRCVIDGELSTLEVVTDIEIRPKSLRVLVPKAKEA